MEGQMKLNKDARALLERIAKADGRLMTQQLGDDSFTIAKRLAKAGYVRPGEHPTVLNGPRTHGVETLVATEAGHAALSEVRD
jgi:hypothetical protein